MNTLNYNFQQNFQDSQKKWLNNKLYKNNIYVPTPLVPVAMAVVPVIQPTVIPQVLIPAPIIINQQVIIIQDQAHAQAQAQAQMYTQTQTQTHVAVHWANQLVVSMAVKTRKPKRKIDLFLFIKVQPKKPDSFDESLCDFKLILNNDPYKTFNYVVERDINKWQKSTVKCIEIQEDKPLVRTENAWKPELDTNGKLKVSPDNKKIKGLLNKLARENHKKIIEETLKLNYSDPEIIEIIFKKVINEPFLSDIYFVYLENLPNIHHALIYMCEYSFKNTRHKNVCNLIYMLCEKQLIKSLDPYFKILMTYLDTDQNQGPNQGPRGSQEDKDKDVEILCEFLKIVKYEKKYNYIYDYIKSIKDVQKVTRFKFLIMNIIDKLVKG